MAEDISVEYGEVGYITADTPAPSPTPSLQSIPQTFTQEQLTGGFYDDFFIDTIYKTDSGLRVIAKAASSNDSTILNSVVRIHRGTTHKEIHWTTQRRNAKPKIPKWTTNDPNEILISQTMNLTNVAEGGGAGTIWRAQGVYTYALLQPKNPQSKYPVGSSPAEIAPSSARWYGPEDFTETILDSAFAAPNTGTTGLPVAIRVVT